MVYKIIAFTIYLVLMVVIGVLTSKQNNSTEEFFLGGRKMGPWVTALSAEASDMSAYLLMGIPGLAFVSGLNEAFWTVVGLFLGTYFNWLFIASPLRKFSEKTQSITIPEFFEKRFCDKNHTIGTVAGFVTLFFFVVYTASAFLSCAKLFVSSFGLNYTLALIISVSVILAYTLMGGFRAVATTDFYQGLLMFASIIITSLVAYRVCTSGGDTLIQSLHRLKIEDSFFNPFSGASKFGALNIISSMAWGLGYFGMPHILVRFMSIRSTKEVSLSRRIAMIWLFFAMGAALVMGIIGKVLLAQKGITISDSETVFARSLEVLFHPFVAGVFLCGILASSMSTADSQLLVASSAFSNDIYKGRLNKNADGTTLFRVSKLTVITIALIAAFLATNPSSSIFRVVSFAWAGFGATFAPVVFASLFIKWVTKKGAIAALITGAVVVVAWKLGLSHLGGVFSIYELLPAFVISFLTMLIVSKLDKADNSEAEALFTKIKSE